MGGQGPSVNNPQQNTVQYIKIGKNNVHTNEQQYFDFATGGKYKSTM